MLTLNDGRSELWQWDTGRTLDVDADCSQVHFSNKVFGRSIDVDVVDGVATIPDILLQTDKDLNVWAFVGTAENGYTKISKTFNVNRRNKPADYVFTPTDQMTLQTIQRQIGDLAELTTEAKDTLVEAINEAARAGGGAGSMDLRVADGYIQYSTDSGSTWQNLIAVAELKGADGSKGDPGAPGKDGHSPVVTATKSGKTTTISVDGAAIATVEDGADGAPGKDGADGSNGKDGKPGEKGADGAPGVYYGTTQPTGDTHPVWIDPDGDHDDGGLLPAVTAADNGKVLRVVNSAWSAADMPTGGTDMGITGASVGQIAKIAAVDASGVPTAWAPVDMPSGGGSTVTWHDDLLAEGTIVANTAIYYDLGVTLAELREYRTFLYLLKGASNVDLNNLYLKLGDSAGVGTIDRGSGGGRICAFEWVDTSKTILRQMHGYSGNPSMVALGKFATDNDSNVGYSLGQWNSMRYVDLSAHAETEHLFLRCSSTPKIEYAYQIRGLTK